MDFFGIGASIRSITATYFAASRATGRSTSLIQSVKDGDRIVFTNSMEAERVRRLCLDRGLQVECMVASPKNPEALRQRGKAKGRTILDHSFVEEIYHLTIKQTADQIDAIERDLSWEEEPPKVSNRTRIERSKFMAWE